MTARADSVSAWQPQVCHEFQAPVAVSEKGSMTTGMVAYMAGESPMERTLLPGYDSGVLCLLIGIFLILAYNFRHYSTFIKNFSTDLWSVRRRENTFSVRTFSETGIQMSVVLLACVSEGIIVNSVMTREGVSGPLSTFGAIAAVTLVALLYYLWQLAAYRTVGYVFTDKVSSRLWLKGFNASQSLLGLALVAPALVVLFNPGAVVVVFPMGVLFYFMARFIFICKGFRLFYDNFGSLIYFILYLCTLEIVPLVLLYRGIGFLSML